MTAAALHKTHAKKPWPDYAFISTEQIMDEFERHGFVLQNASGSDTFGKHMVTMRPADDHRLPGLPKRHETQSRVVIMNSHDATSALRIWTGAIRFVCMNGMVWGDNLANIRVEHIKSQVKELPQRIEEMAARADGVGEVIARMARKRLTNAAIDEFTRRAVDARLNLNRRTPLDAMGVDYQLPALRDEDDHNDLYSIFSKVQERVIRGGIRYNYRRQVGGHTELRAQVTRNLVGRDSVVSMNQKVVELAEAML